MQNHAVTAAVSLILCIAVTNAQWTPDPFCPYPSDHVTRYPYYGNCSLYWECYNGAKYVMACPQGLEFNAPLQQCDAPEIANCDPYAPTTDNPNHTTDDATTESTLSTDNPGTTTQGPYPQCPNNYEIVYFPYVGDCSKYWECYGGHAYLYTCPNGLWWHREITNCDYPGQYCNDSRSGE